MLDHFFATETAISCTCICTHTPRSISCLSWVLQLDNFFKRSDLHLLLSLCLINYFFSKATAPPPLTRCPPGTHSLGVFIIRNSAPPVRRGWAEGGANSEGSWRNFLNQAALCCGCCQPTFAHSRFLMITLSGLEMSEAAVVESDLIVSPPLNGLCFLLSSGETHFKCAWIVFFGRLLQ